MLDLKAIRQNPSPFIKAMKDRNSSAEPIEKIVSLDKEWRTLKNQNEEFKAEKNLLSSQINEAKKAGQTIEKFLHRTKQLGSEIKELDARQKSLEEEMASILYSVPNIPDASVPIGDDETYNVEIRKWGKPNKTSKDGMPHYELGAMLGLMDFERGAKLAGSRFTVLYGSLARLRRALAYYMLEMAISKGYKECFVPDIVNSASMRGTGQLPKFSDELYKLEGTDYWMIPTTEVPLVNLHAGEVLAEEDLPIKYCGCTGNYRKEAGNYQKDIKGILRQHQFGKIELVKFCLPEHSNSELEGLVKDASSVLEGLGLPYRQVQLCTSDMGFCAAKAYDLEVWLPSQDNYREIVSSSNCTDFQARRANIKFRRNDKNEFVHTLNSTAIAIERSMVAILENFQEDDGVNIPKALQDFMQCERIEFSK